jgi:hypothetical protein
MDGINMDRNKRTDIKALRYLNSLYMGDGQYIITSFPPQKTNISIRQTADPKKSSLLKYMPDVL